MQRLAEVAFEVNEKTENIGARRLHTVMERLLETVSFDAADRSGTQLVIDRAYVESNLGELVARSGSVALHPLAATCRSPPTSRYARARASSTCCFDDGSHFELPFEYLRVFSPSAEVTGHGAGEGVLQTGKEDVGIERIEPVGNYALRLHFDDGHDTGTLFVELAARARRAARAAKWERYLERCAEAGVERAARAPEAPR